MHIAPLGTESQTFRKLREEYLDKAVKYESNIDIMGLDGSPLTILTLEDDTSRAPSPFLVRGTADTLTV